MKLTDLMKEIDLEHKYKIGYICDIERKSDGTWTLGIFKASDNSINLEFNTKVDFLSLEDIEAEDWIQTDPSDYL